MSHVIRIDGAEYPVPPTSSTLPSVLLVGLPKSGTTLLTKIFARASELVGVTHLDLHGQLYRAGLTITDELVAQLREIFEPAGYCYGAFRAPFPFLRGAGKKNLPVIWIRRDPKDVIVSRYFSDAYSHPPPGGKAAEAFHAQRAEIRAMGVDEFARREIDVQIGFVRQFLAVVPANNLHVWWYEDVIYEKPRWIREMMQVCGWPLTDVQIAAILEQVDVVPEAEDPQQFIRQVHPGNYSKHLAPATVAAIDERFLAELPAWRRGGG